MLNMRVFAQLNFAQKGMTQMFYALKRVLLVIVLVCMTAPACSGSFTDSPIKIAEDSQFTYYLDTSTISHAPNPGNWISHAKVWTILEMKNPRRDPRQGWTAQSAKVEHNVFCPTDASARALQMTSMMFFSGHMGTETIVFEVNSPREAEWVQASGNDLKIAKILDVVCTTINTPT
jgi:hypothetical protein